VVVYCGGGTTMTVLKIRCADLDHRGGEAADEVETRR